MIRRIRRCTLQYTVYLALIEVMNETPNTIKATGGFAKSEIWRQMMADILILILSCHESYRCMCTRTESNREIDDFSIIEEMVGTTNAHQPNQNTVAIYQELVKIFINISRSITESYSEIANFQRKHISN